MPLYTYRCREGHLLEEFRNLESRNNPAWCRDHLSPAPREFTLPQFIMRPAGYSLKPGDKGYWSFENANGTQDRGKITPFQKEEERLKSPVTFAEDE